MMNHPITDVRPTADEGKEAPSIVPRPPPLIASPIPLNISNYATVAENSSYYTDLFGRDRATELFLRIQQSTVWVPLSETVFRIYGKVNQLRRDKAFYCDSVPGVEGGQYLYRYEPGTNNYWRCQPWTPVLKEILDALNAKFPDAHLNHCVVSRYLDETDDGLHRDMKRDCVEGADVYTVSFGGTRLFEIRRDEDDETEQFDIAHDSLSVLSGADNDTWKHSIVQEKREPRAMRISLTFRSIKTVMHSNGRWPKEHLADFRFCIRLHRLPTVLRTLIGDIAWGPGLQWKPTALQKLIGDIAWGPASLWKHRHSQAINPLRGLSV